MGKGGIMSSKWTTIILVIVLIALAIVVYWIMWGKGFDGCKPKPKATPPGKISMLQDYQPIYSELAVTADLSWKKLV